MSVIGSWHFLSYSLDRAKDFVEPPANLIGDGKIHLTEHGVDGFDLPQSKAPARDKRSGHAHSAQLAAGLSRGCPSPAPLWPRRQETSAGCQLLSRLAGIPPKAYDYEAPDLPIQKGKSMQTWMDLSVKNNPT